MSNPTPDPENPTAVPHSDPPPVDHRSMVEALALCAAGLGWHAVGAKSLPSEITFVCRPTHP